MWDSSHTHTHHTINQIGASQSPPLKSLTSSLRPTLWGSVSKLTRDYRAGSNTICNDSRKSASHICAIPQKDQSQLRLLVVVNKTQFNSVNTRCGTHHTPTHITQSIKLGHHNILSRWHYSCIPLSQVLLFYYKILLNQSQYPTNSHLFLSFLTLFE